jgi:hypothetical protein
MTSKPFYLSLTIVGALVHLFITLAALFGVDLGDQSDAIMKTIEQCTLAGASLLATFSTIVGRIRARKAITLTGAPSGPPSPFLKILLLVVTGASVGVLTGCAPIAAATGTAGARQATAGSPATLSSALTTIGFTVANYLQTLNDGTTIPQVDQVLTATHNSGDTAVVNLVTSLVGQMAAAIVAAHNAGATPTQTQASVNTVLAPAAVAQTAAHVTAAAPTALTN